MLTRIAVRSALWGLGIYLLWAFVCWDANPGAWSVDERGPAAFIWVFGAVALWLWELD